MCVYLQRPVADRVPLRLVLVENPFDPILTALTEAAVAAVAGEGGGGSGGGAVDGVGGLTLAFPASHSMPLTAASLLHCNRADPKAKALLLLHLPPPTPLSLSVPLRVRLCVCVLMHIVGACTMGVMGAPPNSYWEPDSTPLCVS